MPPKQQQNNKTKAKPAMVNNNITVAASKARPRRVPRNSSASSSSPYALTLADPESVRGVRIPDEDTRDSCVAPTTFALSPTAVTGGPNPNLYFITLTPYSPVNAVCSTGTITTPNITPGTSTSVPNATALQASSTDPNMVRPVSACIKWADNNPTLSTGGIVYAANIPAYSTASGNPNTTYNIDALKAFGTVFRYSSNGCAVWYPRKTPSYQNALLNWYANGAINSEATTLILIFELVANMAPPVCTVTINWEVMVSDPQANILSFTPSPCSYREMQLAANAKAQLPVVYCMSTDVESGSVARAAGRVGFATRSFDGTKAIAAAKTGLSLLAQAAKVVAPLAISSALRAKLNKPMPLAIGWK